MTSKVIIEANHGWPVDVFAHDRPADPDGNTTGVLLARVPADGKRDFHVHSHRDLFIHEVQLAEIAEEQAKLFDPEGTTKMIVVDAPGSEAVEPALNDPVRLQLSGERGSVIGIAHYARRPPSYLVEYLTGDGRQTDNWFDRESLVTFT